MVAEVRRQGVTDSRVLRAMLEVPRHRFVPAHRADEAYGPGPLPIACGQTISAPAMVGATAALLELTGRERVLEVGTGSGYAAAVLSRCAREVISIEYHPSLAAGARAALAATEIASKGALSGALLGQLTERGVLVCPVGHGRRGDLVRMRRDGRIERFMPVSFVPLL